jgi:hypothetical protein
VLWSSQISVRLAPPIFVDDISESDTADGSEPSHRVANQQQGIGMDAGRQSERGLRFLLKISSKGLSMSHHDNNSGFTTTNRSGSLNIIQHVRPLGRSGWYNYYGCASIEDMAKSPGLTFQGSGSADVDYLLNFLSITNYTDDLLGDSAE